MSVTVTVALLGFGLLERQLLHAGLHDAARKAGRKVAFETTRDAIGADLVVADVDDPEVTNLVRRLGLLGRTVAVGDRPLPRVACQLAHPLDAGAVAEALARLVPSCMPRSAAAAGAQVARVLEELAFFKHRAGPPGRDRHAATSSTGRPASAAR
jgi:hypothetical protein